MKKVSLKIYILKMLLPWIIILFLLLIIFISISINETENNIKKKYLAEITVKSSYKLNDFFMTILKNGSFLIESDEVKSMNPDIYFPYFKKFKNIYTSIEEIFITNTNGKGLSDTYNIIDLSSIKDFSNIFINNYSFFISDLITIKEKKSQIYILFPIKKNNVYSGLLGFIITKNKFIEVIKELTVSSDIQTILIDSQKNTVYSDYKANLKKLNFLPEGNFGLINSSYLENTNIAYAKINYTNNWHLIFISQKNIIFSDFNKMIFGILIISVISFIFILIGILKFRNELYEEFQLLMKDMDDFTKTKSFSIDEKLEKVSIIEFSELIQEYDTMTLEISSAFEEISASNEELKNAYDELEKAYDFFADRMVEVVDRYDEGTGDHVLRVGVMAEFVAKKMNFNESFCHEIRKFAPLHDLGKIAVPQNILFKAGILNKNEWEIMKSHTIHGAEILDNHPIFKVARNIALYHHEKYNGTGYPMGLKGNNIPIEAAIVSLVDVYDALRTKRTYKESYTHNEAFRIITKGDFRTDPADFNPEVLKVFIDNEEEFLKLWENYTVWPYT